MPKVYNKHYAGVPDDAVCIERTTEWGNPFPVRDGRTRDQAIDAFREWALSDPDYVRAVKRELSGKDLVCCCKPKRCHGDVLLEIANGS